MEHLIYDREWTRLIQENGKAILQQDLIWKGFYWHGDSRATILTIRFIHREKLDGGLRFDPYSKLEFEIS